MAKHNIKGSHPSYAIAESGDTWIFTKNSTVISNDIDAVTATGIANTSIVVEGLISSSGHNGLTTSGTNVDVNVAEGGRIFAGNYGIDSMSVGSKITIAGRVEAFIAVFSQGANVEIVIAKGGKAIGNSGYAVNSTGDNVDIDNHGTITGRLTLSGYGVEVHNSGRMTVDPDFQTILSTGDDMHFVNEKSGTIIGGIEIDTDTGESSRTVNHGNIRSDTWAFLSHSGDDRLTNDGKITGVIALGWGNDVVVMRGGTLNGHIRGDVGDDTLITNNAKYVLEEYDGEGEDTIKSSVSYRLDPTYFVERLELIGNRNINATGTAQSERLTGNSGDNVLSGRGGPDYFDGKGGDDVLKSGTDGVENRFFFSTGYDHDTIQHFDIGLDTIYLGGWNAIDDFDDLLSHAKNHGDDVVIAAGRDSLTILDVHKAELQAGDFSFLG